MIVFPCQVCQTPLSAEEAQARLMVRCPVCSATLRVPANAGGEAVLIDGGADRQRHGGGQLVGMQGSGRRYGFSCGYCSSRLEANESMAAQEAQCPTCGNNVTIPILDRYGRLIDPRTHQIIRQDPHPVHAYAAAGDRAPRILRQNERQVIQCPRCRGISAITANNCKACGMPFTLEGTTVEATGASNLFCVASLVLGIIGLPAACTVIAPVLAVVFGIIGYNQVSRAGAESGGRGLAIAGIVLGVAGCLIGLWFHAR